MAPEYEIKYNFEVDDYEESGLDDEQEDLEDCEILGDHEEEDKGWPQVPSLSRNPSLASNVDRSLDSDSNIAMKISAVRTKNSKNNLPLLRNRAEREAYIQWIREVYDFDQTSHHSDEIFDAPPTRRVATATARRSSTPNFTQPRQRRHGVRSAENV